MQAVYLGGFAASLRLFRKPSYSELVLLVLETLLVYMLFTSAVSARVCKSHFSCALPPRGHFCNITSGSSVKVTAVPRPYHDKSIPHSS